MGNARSIFKKVKSLNDNRVSHSFDNNDYMNRLMEATARRARTDKSFIAKKVKQASDDRLNSRVANTVHPRVTHIALHSRKRDGTYFIDHIWC